MRTKCCRCSRPMIAREELEICPACLIEANRILLARREQAGIKTAATTAA